MKRALTGIAAAAVVLGTAAPMAFAATSSSSLTPAGQKSFVFNGSTVSNPYIMTGQDAGTTTSYAPIYYFDQLLNQAGITATWNGNTHTWALSDSSIDASNVSVAGGVGTGNTTITLNGTTIKMINTYAAQDPGAKKGQMTTYFPVYYVQTLFQAVGINATWNGSTGLTVTTAAPGLSVAVTGSTIGDGSSTNPYINENGASQTVAATLTDASGNPVANSTLDLTIVGQNAPNIAQGSNYSTLSAASADNTWTTSVTTDSNGVATFTVSGEGAYAITIAGTGTESNDSTTVNLANGDGDAVVTPSAASPSISSATSSTAGVVPLTVTLPESGSSAAANQAVTFYVSTSSGAVFTNSTGQEIDTTTGNGYKAYTAYTDANGQATAYVNSFTSGTATVYVQTGGMVTSFDTSSASPNEAILNYQSPATAATTASGLTVSENGDAFASDFVNTIDAPYVNSISGVGDSTSTPVFVAPLSSTADSSDAVQTGSVTYNLTFASGQNLSNLFLDNNNSTKADVAFDTTTTNGTTAYDTVGDLPSAATTTSTVQLTATWDSTNNQYDWYVNGVELKEHTQTNVFGFQASAAGEVTITSGSASATATFVASTATPAYTSYLTPGNLNLQTAGTEDVTFTVDDTSGNPVDGQMVPVEFDGTSTAGLWLAAVNGTALTGTVNTGTSTYGAENTPIPLFNTAANTQYAPDPIGYSAVSVPGVVAWSSTNPDIIDVETDSSGNVKLSLGTGSIQYWTASNGPQYSVAPNGTTLSTTAYTYWGYSTAGTNPSNGVLYLTNGTAPTGYQSVGSISW